MDAITLLKKGGADRRAIVDEIIKARTVTKRRPKKAADRH